MAKTSRRQTGIETIVTINDANGDTASPLRYDRDTSLDVDNTFKRSGPHNLDRTGYDEGKCRNVLVRYCAHIPRNYQYKDGIQQIFLILREHLGDENLDLAGGVLYELIEVDCEHTDDPGAAFQRWKHDHLRRHADLELPHVPHMTTITSSIVPTERLVHWRTKYPERYPFVLSDSSPVERSSVDPSCIRHRKAWLIDHTLYISSRSDGTRPLNSPNPKKFHEMQWNQGYSTKGKLIEERDISIVSPDRPSLVSRTGAAENSLDVSGDLKGLRRSVRGLGILEKFRSSFSMHKQKSGSEIKRRSWMPTALMIETAALFRDKGSNSEVAVVPLPGGCRIPNAIFARKFSLVEIGDSLPPYLSLRQMPTAESKATETIVEAANKGLLNGAPTWSFRGPFTPQLGFDGGLDYQWTPEESTISCKRFDADTSTHDAVASYLDSRFEGYDFERTIDYARQPTSTKRQGMIFDTSVTGEDENEMMAQLSANYTTSNSATPSNLGASTPRILDPTTYEPPRQDESLVSGGRREMTYSAPSRVRLAAAERYSPSLNALLFQNIEFAIPVEIPGQESTGLNRKTTVVERVPSTPLQSVNASRNEHAHHVVDTISLYSDMMQRGERADKEY